MRSQCLISVEYHVRIDRQSVLILVLFPNNLSRFPHIYCNSGGATGWTRGGGGLVLPYISHRGQFSNSSKSSEKGESTEWHKKS